MASKYKKRERDVEDEEEVDRPALKRQRLEHESDSSSSSSVSSYLKNLNRHCKKLAEEHNGLVTPTLAHGMYKQRVVFVGSFGTNKDHQHRLTLERKESATRQVADTISIGLFGEVASTAGILMDLFPSREKKFIDDPSCNYREPRQLSLFKLPTIEYLVGSAPSHIVFLAPSSARILTADLKAKLPSTILITPDEHVSALLDTRSLDSHRIQAANSLATKLTSGFDLGSFFFLRSSSLNYFLPFRRFSSVLSR